MFLSRANLRTFARLGAFSTRPLPQTVGDQRCKYNFSSGRKLRSFNLLDAMSTKSLPQTISEQRCSYRFSSRRRATMMGASCFARQHMLNSSLGLAAVPSHFFRQPCRPFVGTTAGPDFYSLLGVKSTASAAEIKKAYFKMAKETHPDLNRDNPVAKERFQKVNDAYSVLKNSSKRKQYDRHRRSGDYTEWAQHENYGSRQQEQEDMFKSVWADFGVEDYITNLKEELSGAVEDVKKRGDWTRVHEFASEHRVLILGVVVPLAAALRFPGLVMAGLRVALFVPGVLWASLPPIVKLAVGSHLWRLLVSKSQRN